MATSRNQHGFRIEEMNGADRALVDILSSVRRPDGYCMMTVDFSYAEAFRQARIQQTGVPITLIDMCLRAIALTFGKDDAIRTLVHGYRRYQSETIDIGCLVAAATTVAPIIVFKSIDQLSLEEISTQRSAMIKEAREDEKKRLAELERMTKFIPDRIRRTLIGRFARDPRERKKLAGTLQFSAIELDDLDWMCPAHIGGAMVISMGGIKERPMVVDGQVVPRLCGLITFMIDQRTVHPTRAMRIFRRFRRLLENPQKLV